MDSPRKPKQKVDEEKMYMLHVYMLPDALIHLDQKCKTSKNIQTHRF